MLPLAALLVLQLGDLPDVSRAGYRGGQEPPRLERTVDARGFGVVPDDDVDDAPAIQKALDETRGPAAIVLPPGRLILGRPLRIGSDGLVLRGSGSEGEGATVLVCPRPLSELNPDADAKKWSWSGGMVEIRPAKPASPGKAFRVERPADDGSRTFIADVPFFAKGPAPGVWYELTQKNDSKDTLLDWIYGGVVPKKRMGDELRRRVGHNLRAWVHVVAVDGDRVTLEDPLPFPEWTARFARRTAIFEAGVEDLAFAFPETTYPGHLKEKGYNALQLQDAIDCWVRNVHITNADSGVFVARSRRVTVTGVVLQGRMMHHALSASWASDCLITRWRMEAPHRHGTTVSWSAHNNVFSKGWGRELALDAHRATPFRNVHTDIEIVHGPSPRQPLRSGGGADRGPHAARENVYWNIRQRFEADGETFVVDGLDEWPLATFAGWHGDREISLPVLGALRQTLLFANEAPAVVDLHLAQRADRAASGR